MAYLKESAFELLRASLREGRLAHAHLVTGVSGSGKAWLAERLASELLGCTPDKLLAHPDVHILHPESKSRRITIDQIRNIENALHRKPLVGTNSVAIIHDADRLVEAAANAFLKTLEEPPSGVTMILTSTLPEAMLETVISRCVETALQGEPTALTPEAQRVVAALGVCLLESPTVAGAFTLTRTVQDVLSRVRERISAEHEATLKEEAKRYKNATGDDSWIEEREAQIKALAEATGIREREKLLSAILFVLGGTLRVLHGGDAPHPLCAQLATRYDTDTLLSKIDAWEEMRRRLALNINEGLVLESSFLAIAIELA